MKTATNIVGALLILFGIFALIYRGVNYETKEPVAQLKIPNVTNIEVTEKHEKVFFIPPLVAATSIVAGVVLVVITRVGKNKRLK